LSKRKAASSPAPSDRHTKKNKGRSRASGSTALFAVADSISAVAEGLVYGDRPGSVMLSPQRKTAAIQAAERDEGLSVPDLVQMTQLFQRKQGAADGYLALTNKEARRQFLRAELDSEFKVVE
jgi:hypothetical protein